MKIRNFIYFILFLSFFSNFSISLASVSDGTASTNKFAKFLSDGSRINMSVAEPYKMHVLDSHLTGFVWSTNYGWIVLNCANTTSGCTVGNGSFKVANDGEGNLSGYAWGERTGWIKFRSTVGNPNHKVTISSSGEWSGFAWSQNFGWISFNCSDLGTCGSDNYKISTDWIPASARTTTQASTASQSGQQHSDQNQTSTGQEQPTPAPSLVPSTSPEDSGPTGDPVASTASVANISPSSPSEGGNAPAGAGSSGGPTTKSSQNILEIIKEEIVSSYEFARDVVVEIKRELKRIITSPTGSIFTKTGAVLGVVGTGAFVATSLFLNPLSISEIFLLPFRLWSLLMEALGIKKRKLPWGTVYDSVTKEPLDPAYVVLMDENENSLKESITDLDGRYGFFVPPAKFKIVANKTNYTFPSKRLAGKSSDFLYTNLYFGENLNPLEFPTGIINKNIPMDRENFDWNEFTKQEKQLTKFYSKRDKILRRVSGISFIVGSAISVVALLVAPEPYNIATVCVYTAVALLKKFSIGHKTTGSIKDQNGDTIPYAVVKVFGIDGTELMKKVADNLGRYYCLVPKGEEYIVTIEKKISEEEYVEVYKSEPIRAKNGIINQDFSI